MKLIEVLSKYAPVYVPLAALVLLVVFMRTYLYKGMVSAEIMDSMFNSERKQIELFAKIEQEMGQLSRGTAEVRAVVQELRSDVDELRQLMFAHHSAGKELLAGLGKRQDDFLSA